MNQKQTELYITRIERFMERLTKAVLSHKHPLTARYCPSEAPVPWAERQSGEFKPIQQGQEWGKRWSSAWFHLTGTVPDDWAGKQVYAHLDFGGEGLIFDQEGCPVQGLSNGSVFVYDFNRDLFPLFKRCKGGERVDLWIETAANGLFGMFTEQDPGADHPNRYGRYDASVEAIELCVFEQELWELWLDLRILHGLIKTLPEKGVRRARIIYTVSKAIDSCRDFSEDAAWMREQLAEELDKPAEASNPCVLAVGHAHIDTAWLWPVAESVRKCARTFASQIDLIKRYPGYIFGASQPQHYAFVKEHYPQLYEQIKKWVRAGRWECQGGMWVEADCNLISGESMVRQVLHGKNFFKDEFGVDVKNLWLPDVFGYSAAMPQILKKAGMDFFLTQKISWSQFNEFPHHTFNWRGIDGSEVLTHFPPENTYNSQLGTDYLVPAMEHFKERAYLDEFISLFGVGDGGGGPKAENLELGKRMVDLEGAPRLSFGSAAEFFDRLQHRAEELPTWVGELYLELHRGTLTTHGKVKQANRKLELGLREVEMLWSCLPLEDYPLERLDQVWKKVMLNQFHDILPGSSITKVYEVTHREHQEALDAVAEMKAQAAQRLLRESEGHLVFFNSLSKPWSGAHLLPEGWQGLQDMDGGTIPCQQEAEGTVALLELPPMSLVTFKRDSSAHSAALDEELILENDLIRYEFSVNGWLEKAYDKVMQRNILSGQPSNRLTLYDDHPNNWDAWDVDLFYENHVIGTAESIEARVLARGPVRQGLFFNLKIGNSTVTQRVYLRANSRRLDFETKVVWREKHRMLRTAFEIDLRTDQASFDIQYGYVKRNTHRNTSWDLARFEVAAHKYVDLANHDWGVALLNDCKYGHKVHDNILDLNLLRAPNYPDPDADEGQHEFTYSLLPHEGDLIHSDVWLEAARLNQPPALFPARTTGDRLPAWQLDGDGLSLEVVKKAEKENCLILRIVEIHGRRSQGTLRVAVGSELVETDLMEWSDGEPFELESSLELELAPFEIRTFKLQT